MENISAENQSPREFWGKANEKRNDIIIVIFAVLFMISIFVIPIDRGVTAFVSAVNYDETGIAPNSSFLVTLPGVNNIRQVPPMVAFEPFYEFTVTATDEPHVFKISTDTLMAKNSQININARGKDFEFMVRNELMITNVFPADGAGRVNVDSPLIFTFNSDSISAIDFSYSLAFFRSRDGHYEYFKSSPQEGNDIQVTATYNLRFGTTYHITVSPTFYDAGGARLREPFVFSFTTRPEPRQGTSNRQFELARGMASVNIIDGDVPILDAWIHGYSRSQSSVVIREFDGWESFYAAIDQEVDLEDMPIIAEFDGLLIQEHSWRHQIVFPEALPLGWYHVQVTVGTAAQSATREVLMQVSDLSVFYMTVGDEAVVWVHDIVTGNPAVGAVVNFDGDVTSRGTTDDNGVLHLFDMELNEFDEDRGRWWQVEKRFTVAYGDRMFVADDSYSAWLREQWTTEASRRYMSYIYTDRDIYRTTDTIKVWGIVMPRNPDTPLPEGLQLKLRRSRVTQPITLLPDGTFMAEIELESVLTAHWESLSLITADGDVINSRSLTIDDFTTPIFRASVTPDEQVFLLDGLDDGNIVGANINISTFDGTPAMDYALRINSSWWGSRSFVVEEGSQNVATDRNGNVNVQFVITENPNTWRPSSYRFHFDGTEPESENVAGDGTIHAIHRDVMLVGRFDSKANSIEVNTHRIDLSNADRAFNRWGWNWNNSVLRGEPLSQEITATVYRIAFVREKVGTFLDPIRGIERNRYRHVRREEIIDTRTFTTIDGSYTLSDLPVPLRHQSNFVVLSTMDSRGLKVEERVHIWRSGVQFSDGREDDGIHRYILVLNDDPEFISSEIDYDRCCCWCWWWGSEWWWLYGNRSRFVDDQDAVFTLFNNINMVEDTSGFILSAVAQEGFTNVSVTSDNQVTVPFAKNLIPNYTLTGAFFDGRHVFELGNTYMNFNPERRELEITLESESGVYAPGEEMHLTATVIDVFTGLPKQNATLLVSVADEAVFAVREQHVNLLRSLYRRVFFPRIHSYTSFNQFRALGNGSGNGGEGEPDIRDDFPATAHFATVYTNENGVAKITIPLPDNITSWRITALAVTECGRAGNTRKNITATLDYFVQPIVSETLIEGDSFVVGLLSAGRGVDINDHVSYSVRLIGEGVDISREATSTIRGFTSVDFGQLARGDYTVTIIGESGEFQDAIRLPVQVITSGIEISRVETFNLSDGINVEPLRWPISIVFYNENSSIYNEVFRSISRNSWSGWHTESRIARRFVAARDSWHRVAFGQENVSDIAERHLLRPFTHSNPSVELTVLANLALPEWFEPVEYAWDLRYDAGRPSARFIMQALAGQEIELDLSRAIAQGDDIDHIDKIYMAVAMYIAGDTAGARRWYNTLVRNLRTEQLGIAGITAFSITDPDETLSRRQTTAAALMFATLLEHDDAHGFALYLSQNRRRFEELHLLEKIFYLQTFPPSGEEESLFSFELNGETITHTITNNSVRVRLNRSEFAQANFTVLSGHVYADVYFIGTPEQLEDAPNRLIGVTKTLTPIGGEFRPGVLVRVTIRPDLSAFNVAIGRTQLIINDYIPTGMRFERFGLTPGQPFGHVRWHLSHRQGQRLQFSATGGWHGASGTYLSLGSIVYYVRCILPGTYVVESAYINSAVADTWGASERSTVTILE